MEYYIATELPNRPFIQWERWARSIVELAEMGEFENPLIVAKNLIPAFQYGVCPWKIIDGELVARPSEEMDVFEAEYIARLSVATQAKKIELIDAAKFSYSGKDFPMDPAARMRYLAIALDVPANQNFITVTGEVIAVSEADLPTFLSKFYKEVQLITNVSISEE